MSESLDDDEIVYEENLKVKTNTTKDSVGVWLYFGKILRADLDGNFNEIDKKHNYCDLCLKEKVLKRYRLSTAITNLRNHLRDKHNITIQHKKSDKNQRLVTEMLSSVGQPQSLAPIVSQSRSSDAKYILARQLCLWFCRDFISFNEINKPGIRDFCVWARIIKPNENLPDRKTLAGAALNDIYTSLYSFVKIFVQAKLPKTISTSFDFWSDNAKRISYINYWIHWIDSDFVMQKLCLKIAHFPHPHTGEQISDEFLRVKDEFGLQNKKFLAVTDNGSNLIKACRLLKMDRDPCLYHNLHLLISVDLIKNHVSLQPIRDLIRRMKKINKALMYKYDELKKINDDEFNKTLYSIVSSLENVSELLEYSNFTLSEFDIEDDDEKMVTKFCKDQIRNGTQYTTVKNSNVTRWNSVLSMFNSFEHNIDTINNCLASMKKFELILSDTELKLCSDFVVVLKIFEKATDVLQGERYPTLNLATFCYLEIKDSLSKSLADENSSSIIKTSVEFLLQTLDERFIITENMIVATFLDPSAQKLPLILQYLNRNDTDMPTILTKKWFEYNVELDENIAATTKHNSSKNTKESASPPAKRIRMEFIKKHTSSDDTTDDSPLSSITIELSSYTINHSEYVDEPLVWWKRNSVVYPYLSALAKVMLSIPASSGSTERHFSQAGGLITKKKAQLDPLTAKKVMFVHDNYKYASQSGISVGY